MILYFCAFILAASLGAALRYHTTNYFILPLGTLVVNILGSFLIGFLFIALQKYSPSVRVVVIVAFLGSLTTFSGFSFEMLQYFQQGALGKALSYGLSTNLLCILGCFLGYSLAQKLFINF